MDRDDELEAKAYDGGFNASVKNEVQGIGLSTFSNNSRWGAEEKLQGVIFFSIYELYHTYGFSDIHLPIIHQFTEPRREHPYPPSTRPHGLNRGSELKAK